MHLQAAFVLPQTFPVTRDTLNYAGVAVGIVMLGTVIFWFLPGSLGARNWYRGEIKTARVGIDSVQLTDLTSQPERTASTRGQGTPL